MSTWTCKVALSSLIAMLLSGCEATSKLAFAPDLGALRPNKEQTRISQMTLADGAVTLNAPSGYCIDPKSMRRANATGFVLLARCDTLGIKGGFGGFDLAIITVTTTPRTSGDEIPNVTDVALSADAADVLAENSSEDLSLVRLISDVPVMDGVSEEHWRGVFSVNDTLVGLGLYAPKNSPALKDSGASTLRELATRTMQASRT